VTAPTSAHLHTVDTFDGWQMKYILTCLLAFYAHAALAYSSIPCPTPQSNDIVLLVAGQSNGGSYGDVAYQPPLSGTPGGDIQVWFGTGICYPLNDALAGFPPPPMSGSGGSIWTRFSQLLRDHYPSWTGRLVLVNIAKNGTPVVSWANGAGNYPRIAAAVSVLSSLGWSPKAMVFMGGESDGIAGNSYTQVFNAINSMVDGVRLAGHTWPIFVGVTTTCRFSTSATPIGVDFESLTNAATRDYQAAAQRIYQQSEVQRALMAMNDPSRSVYIGPNTDLISAANRWDQCHMASYAQWLSAQLTLDVLVRAGLVP
jgi:hypothetical protein